MGNDDGLDGEQDRADENQGPGGREARHEVMVMDSERTTDPRSRGRDKLGGYEV